jgi:hypothetical protein
LRKRFHDYGCQQGDLHEGAFVGAIDYPFVSNLPSTETADQFQFLEADFTGNFEFKTRIVHFQFQGAKHFERC